MYSTVTVLRSVAVACWVGSILVFYTEYTAESRAAVTVTVKNVLRGTAAWGSQSHAVRRQTAPVNESLNSYSKVWSVRNRAPGIARLDFLSSLRNRALVRLNF